MWFRAVFGEMTSRAAISLLGQPACEQPQDLDLARGEPGGPGHVGAGRDGPAAASTASTASASSLPARDVRPQLGGRLSADSAGRYGRGSRIDW